MVQRRIVRFICTSTFGYRNPIIPIPELPVNMASDSELQVQAYLRFAKCKRDQHVREVLSTISDFKSEHIRPGVCAGVGLAHRRAENLYAI